MKKETRVKELPKVLADLLNNKFNLNGSEIAEDYFSEIDWTKATDAERLAYCEVRYKEGDSLVYLVDGNVTIEGVPYIYENDICFNTKSLLVGFVAVYNHKTGKFAEIISDEVEEPSIKEKLKGTCVLNEKEGMGAEIVKLYTEAGFDDPFKYKGTNLGKYYGVSNDDDSIDWMVDFNRLGKVLTLDQLRSIVKGEKETTVEILQKGIDNLDKMSPEEVQDRTKKAGIVAESVEFKEGEIVDEYRGGEVYRPVVYRFFAEEKHWVSRDRGETTVFSPEEIRKIDQDADLKKIADEVMDKRNAKRDFIRCNINTDSVRDMLIEMGKRAQSKK